MFGGFKNENLSKVYGREKRQKLWTMFLFGKPREFIAIVGPSGSGNQPSPHLLGGVDIPTSGKVFVNNTDVYSDGTQLAIFRRRQMDLFINSITLFLS